MQRSSHPRGGLVGGASLRIGLAASDRLPKVPRGPRRPADRRSLCRSLGRWLAIPCLLLAASTTSVFADEPTIAELISGKPVLSTIDSELEQFEFVLATSEIAEMQFELSFAWRRPDRVRALISIGEERTPMVYTCESGWLLFDLTTSSVLIASTSAPTFTLHLDDSRTRVAFGSHGDDPQDPEEDEPETQPPSEPASKAAGEPASKETGEPASNAAGARVDLRIDLPAMLRGFLDNGQLDRDEQGHWRLTRRAIKEDRSRIEIATFSDQAGYPLRSFDVHSEDDELVISLRELRLNEPPDLEWPPFPAADAFPAGLHVVRLDDDKQTSIWAAGAWLLQISRLALAHVGLRSEEMRQTPLLFGIDWEQARQTNDRLGAALRDLLAFQRPPTATPSNTTNPQPAPRPNN